MWQMRYLPSPCTILGSFGGPRLKNLNRSDIDYRQNTRAPSRPSRSTGAPCQVFRVPRPHLGAPITHNEKTCSTVLHFHLKTIRPPPFVPCWLRASSRDVALSTGGHQRSIPCTCRTTARKGRTSRLQRAAVLSVLSGTLASRYRPHHNGDQTRLHWRNSIKPPASEPRSYYGVNGEATVAHGDHKNALAFSSCSLGPFPNWRWPQTVLQGQRTTSQMKTRPRLVSSKVAPASLTSLTTEHIGLPPA